MGKSILEVIHESAKNLHEAGLADAQTMQEFDAMCLTSVVPPGPKETSSN